ncbi:MAG: hypothetical protein C5B50_23755 [Verrucomicrobia bacterium]|nr:MAG: hypothetical protein C5B50_23755 [Verrucomicrobiota bacterium]
MSYSRTHLVQISTGTVLGRFRNFLVLALAFVLCAVRLSAQTNCAPLPVGIVAWWRAEGDAVDAISGNNGALVNSTDFGAGMVGQGFVFDGYGTYVQLSNAPALQAQSFSIEAWVQRASESEATDTGDPAGYIFGYGSGGYNFGVYNDGRLSLAKAGFSDVQTLPLVTDTSFHHLAVTKAGSTVIFYADGVAYAADSFDPAFTFSTTPVIGALGKDLGNSFWGTIDEVSFYDRPLSPDELQAVYAAGAYGKCAYSLAPVITSQPPNESAPLGGPAYLAVRATGGLPLAYQWELNGSPLIGATNSSFSVQNVSADKLGPYAVLVTNFAGLVLSSNAVLTILQSNCTTMPASLIAWWQGEGSAQDTVGGNDGVLVGGAGYGPAIVNQGFVLSGNRSFVQLANLPALHSQSFTIEAWIKRASAVSATASGSRGGNIFGYGNGGYNLGIYNDGRLSLTKTGNSDVQSSVLITDTNFHHLAATKAGSNVVFYVDGTAYPAALYDPGFTFSTTPVIGALGTTLGASFWGIIDEVSFYNRALSAGEVKSIYDAGSYGKCTSPLSITIYSQPTNETVAAGLTAFFQIDAAGIPRPAYQWEFDGTPLAGATNSFLVLPNVSLNQLGTYSVLVTNSQGSIISSNAVLSLLQSNCVPVPSGIISWWRGENDTVDIAGGNNGTLINGVGYGSGLVGKAFVYDGSFGSYLQLTNSPALQVQTFTIEAWLKRASASAATVFGGGGSIFGYGTGGYNFGIYNDGRLSLTKTGTSDVQTTTLVTDTNYHHLAVTKTGSNVMFYVDGAIYPAPPYDPGFTFSTAPVIGALATGRGDSFWGTIDEVSFYGRALSGAEIQSIYAAGSYGKCVLPPTLTVHPASQVVALGGSAALKEVAFGATPLSYQWNFNGTPLFGATAASLTLSNVQSSQAGFYAVTVSNAFGTVQSSNAFLTVLHPVLYDPSLEFSPTSNPSGPWSYGFSTALGSPMALYTEDLQMNGADVWLTNRSCANVLSAFHNGTTGVLTLSSTIILQPRALGLHPGCDFEYSIARFTVTSAGQYEVVAAFSGLDTQGTTTDVHILTNGTRIFDGLVNGFGQGTGPTIFIAPALKAGDFLDFAVGDGPDGSYANDATGLSVQIGINHPPIAPNLQLATRQNQPVSLQVAKLLLLCSDPDTDPLSVTGVTSPSTNGAAIVLNSGTITYTPPANFIGSDRFNYTVADGHGGSASAYVLVTVAPANQQSANMLPPIIISGGYEVSFLGLPGYTYSLQRASSVTGPWTTLATITTDSNGLGTYADTNPPPGSAFYRTTYP